MELQYVHRVSVLFLSVSGLWRACRLERNLAVNYKPGDLVIYLKSKVSPRPSPRAENVHPAPAGEEYSYAVQKYWIVSAVVDSRTIEVRTRRGKTHRVNVDDPLLRKAGLVDRLFRRSRFPDLTAPVTAETESVPPKPRVE